MMTEILVNSKDDQLRNGVYLSHDDKGRIRRAEKNLQ